jgi:hypothetical protein
MAKLPHPPFCGDPAPSGGNHDWMTKFGARDLADTIKAVWKRAGHDIEVVVEAIPRSGKVEPHYVVRMPTLVRGLPTRQVPA